jgi:hypothetical protein
MTLLPKKDAADHRTENSRALTKIREALASIIKGKQSASTAYTQKHVKIDSGLFFGRVLDSIFERGPKKKSVLKIADTKPHRSNKTIASGKKL